MTNPPPRLGPPFRRQRAFSLIEVALALGVIGVALVALLGMMPIGLATFRDSMHATLQADVLRQLTARFQETPFDRLTNQTAMLYYSDEGALTDETHGLLGVTYAVSTDTGLLKDSGYKTGYLKTVQVFFFTRADRTKPSPAASMTNVIYVPPGVN